MLHVCQTFLYLYRFKKNTVITRLGWRKERSRLPTINMFYYTYISYDDYTILIHSFNCPAIKQVFLFFSPHLIIITNLLLLNIVTHLVESPRFVILVNHHWIINFCTFFLWLLFFYTFNEQTFNWQTVCVREDILLQQRYFRSMTNQWSNKICMTKSYFVAFFFVFLFLYLRTHLRDPSRRATRKKCYGKNECISARPRQKYNQRRTRAK